MNDNKIRTRLDDLKDARKLIEGNFDLLVKYPSLEDSLRFLVRVIELEEDHEDD